MPSFSFCTLRATLRALLYGRRASFRTLPLCRRWCIFAFTSVVVVMITVG